MKSWCKFILYINFFMFFFQMDPTKDSQQNTSLSTTNTITIGTNVLSPAETALSPGGTGTVSIATSRDDEEDSSNQISSDSKSPGNRYVELVTPFLRK
jgi:hypothetical protein